MLLVGKFVDLEGHFAILDKVIAETRMYDIRDIGTETDEEIHAVDLVENISENSVS